MCFRDFSSTSGLDISTKQAMKKWNNLKLKYKVSIRCLFICFVLYTDRAFQGFLHMKLTYTQYHFSGPLNRVTVIKCVIYPDPVFRSLGTPPQAEG